MPLMELMDSDLHQIIQSKQQNKSKIGIQKNQSYDMAIPSQPAIPPTTTAVDPRKILLGRGRVDLPRMLSPASRRGDRYNSRISGGEKAPS